ncbi:helix-turn-helix domain-containing protein [Pseudonocardia kunmingensis]|uniref:Excisionase family DNA binding protein n=1 Tax=Pseudonocardia kunmingensis TaxID=630975 RepID=A0A543E3W5_9PSEU|nr:helix-turn-helix domain-containing protein [Pseudonocardia kunmingensis]TQM16298.1 excisionase family DNA binding protein [Pseudonocardia kunmingensis]
MSPDRLLTTPEAAAALGLSERSLSRWAKEGRLMPTVVTPGNQYRWDLDELREQLRALRKRPD